MKIRTPVPEKKSRLEIIPLIDIMFFLLASFMMISLQMQIVRTVKANLPTATLAISSTKPDIVNLLVTRDGEVIAGEKALSRAKRPARRFTSCVWMAARHRR